MKIHIRLVGGPFDGQVVDMAIDEDTFFVKQVETSGDLAGQLTDYYIGEVDHALPEQIALYAPNETGA